MSDSCRDMSLDKAESFIKKEGREVLRQMLQNYLNHLGSGNVGDHVINARGKILNHKRMGTRHIGDFDTNATKRLAMTHS